jgi:hypothetical protein
MAGVLNLSDSLAHIDRAKRQYDELLGVYRQWMDSGGVGVQVVRDPMFVCYRWNVVVSAEPRENLPLLAGVIVDHLRSALDYVAFQIYLAAGGTPDGPKADKVAFPIVNTAGPWESVVTKKVPGVWPEAADELSAVQPFSQEGEEAKALPTLRGLGGTGKHRNLNLCAAAALSGAARTPPNLPPNAAVQIRLERAPGRDIFDQGPVVPIEPGTAVEVASARVGPRPAPHPDDVFLWASGIQFEEPPPPHVDFGFRANNGAEVSLFGLRGLIEHVEAILHRFGDLQAPT